MGTAERRAELMKTLCRRRHDKISNLAFEFGVSERTIRRDIEILSLSEPIYTQTGRYGGGVYVTGDYSIYRYMTEQETALLEKVYYVVEKKLLYDFTADELSLFFQIIRTYARPKKGR